MSNLLIAERARLAELQLNQLTIRGSSGSRIKALVRITETALTQVSGIHHYAITTARQTLESAEAIHLSAGKSLDDSAFQLATRTYLHRLTFILEGAGIDMLRVINTAFR
jgi:hypothetical protein